MGDLLFYLFKSGCYLIIFYLLFKLLMSGTTFFRFNRMTILVGIVGCMFLPLIELTTEKETFLTVPLQTIQEICVEQVDGIFGDRMFEGQLPVDETRNMQTINWWAVALGYTYLAGGLFTLCKILLSFYRMFQLIRNGKRYSYGKYRLIVVSESISSFCWGKYIVVLVSDYSESINEILLHETMHLRYRHTLDLLCMQFLLILYWFNPAIWLLKRELQEVHEFEADNGVLKAGIDATRYQLLLVKKAVGTRLYSMANGFNHSKLKKRITMMLKERTNRWARLKLLLVVPVMGGALYVFAQPEVKEDLGLHVVPEVLQLKTGGGDQDIFRFIDDEMEAYYKRSPKNAELKDKIREGQAHIVKIDVNGQLTLNKNTISKENLKEVLKKTMVENKRLAKEKYNRIDDQVGGVLFSTNTSQEQLVELLSIMRDAFVEIRADIAKTSGNSGKEYLDKEFPILIGYGETSIRDRKKSPYNNSTSMKITGINLKLISDTGKVEKEITNFTLAELEKDLKDFCALQGEKKEKIVVSMKVDKGCEMGIVADVKTALRNNCLLRLNYQ